MILYSSTFDNIKTNLFTAVFCIDLKKFSIPVSQGILLTELDHYGRRGPAHSFIKSFMLRHQFVSMQDDNSDILKNNFGVPQGSTFGLLLFYCISTTCLTVLVSLHDFLLTIHVWSLVMPIFLFYKIMLIWKSLVFMVGALLTSLSVIPSKCNAIPIAPKLNCPFSNNPIKLNHSLISATDCVRFLPINLDSKLNLLNSVKIIENKCYPALLWVCGDWKRYFHTALTKLYHTLFHPHLVYDLMVGGSIFPFRFTKLVALQNKAVKLICVDHYNDSSTPFYYELETLNVTDLYKFKTAKFMHNFLRKNIRLSYSNFTLWLTKLPDA